MSGQASKKERTKNVVTVLNMARSMELYAIHQYMNQHYTLDDRDYGTFATNIKLIAIDEMRHAEMFADRIKTLSGEPTTDAKATVVKGQEVRAVFAFDVDLEDNTMDSYNQFLKTCRDNGDNVSARLFEQIIDEEQAHQDYFADVDSHITTLGDTYLSKIAGTPSSTGPSRGFVIGTSPAA